MKEKTAYARWAWEVIETFVKGDNIPSKPTDIELPEGSYERKAGVFVTVHRNDGSLRGCIGTFLPTRSCIVDEIRENAIAAVSRDPRFFPVKSEELPELFCSVDILSEPSIVKDIKELDPRKYGIIVEGRFGRGLLLPDLEGVDTVEEQISITRRKAGISPDEDIKIYKFTVERYH
ncbi:MAG: AmmeMemoRadiSam system protein A [Thermotogae bacterium]|nr:AmmeMemoRadiSam system protein A [Thermotogota bacterium]